MLFFSLTHSKSRKVSLISCACFVQIYVLVSWVQSLALGHLLFESSLNGKSQVKLVEQKRRVWAVLWLKDYAESEVWSTGFCHQWAALFQSVDCDLTQWNQGWDPPQTVMRGSITYFWSVLPACFLSADRQNMLCEFQFLSVGHFTFHFSHSNFDKYTVLQGINDLNQSMFNEIKRNIREKCFNIGTWN